MAEEQQDLFGALTQHDSKNPAKPIAPSKNREVSCPDCGAQKSRLVSCIGTNPKGGLAELVTTRSCECGYRWEIRKPRKDVCEHGIVLFVPCKDCGRTWEDIERTGTTEGATGGPSR